jgi:hypothetical protein
VADGGLQTATVQASLQHGHVDDPTRTHGVLPTDGAQDGPIRFGKATPHPVLLSNRQRVSGALSSYRTTLADPLRGGLPQPTTDATQIVIGMEELLAGAIPAPAHHLPFPDLTDRS